MKSDVEYYDKLIAKYSAIGVDSLDLRITREKFESFRVGVEGLLPGDVVRLTKTPDLFSMMRSLNEQRKYLGYIVLSQFAHGSHSATGLYRKNLGNQKSLGEFIDGSTWSTPISSCWYALFSSGRTLLLRLGGDPDAFIDDSFGQTVQVAIDAVK